MATSALFEEMPSEVSSWYEVQSKRGGVTGGLWVEVVVFVVVDVVVVVVVVVVVTTMMGSGYAPAEKGTLP